MKQVPLREFQLKASKYLKELPIVLTQYNTPIATVIPWKSVDTIKQGYPEAQVLTEVSTDVLTLPPTKSERLEYLRSIQKAVESKWVKPIGKDAVVSPVARAEVVTQRAEPLPPQRRGDTFGNQSEVEDEYSEYGNKSPFGKPLSGQKRECPICYKSVPIEWAGKHYADRHGDVGGA